MTPWHTIHTYTHTSYLVTQSVVSRVGLEYIQACIHTHVHTHIHNTQIHTTHKLHSLDTLLPVVPLRRGGGKIRTPASPDGSIGGSPLSHTAGSEQLWLALV